LFGRAVFFSLVWVLASFHLLANVDISTKQSQRKIGKFSRDEINYALNFKKMLRGLERFKLDNKLVKQLVSGSVQSELFYGYHSLLLSAHNISALPSDMDVARFNQHCKIVIPNSTQFPIKHLLATGLDNICKRRFLFLLDRYKGVAGSLLPHLVQRITKRYIPSYLSGAKSLQKEFSKYAGKIDPDDPQYRYLSKVIGSEFRMLPFLKEKQHRRSESQLLLENNSDYIRITSNFLNKEFQQIVRKLRSDIKQKRWASAEEGSTHLLGYYFQNRSYISSTKTYEIISGLGISLLRTPAVKSGLEFLSYAVEIAPPAERDESLFSVIWGNLVAGKPESANLIIDSHNLLNRFNTLPIKLKFWVSHTKKLAGSSQVSQSLFRQTAQSDPLNFYAILALKMLPGDVGKHLEMYSSSSSKKRLIQSRVIPLPYYSNKFNQILSRSILWDRIGDFKLLNFSLNRLMQLERKDSVVGMMVGNGLSEQEFHRSKIIHVLTLLRERKSYLTMFRVIANALDKNHLDFSDSVMRDLFPRPFLSQIKRRTKDKMDPLMVLSLIRQESAFNPRARSSAGARGLMQLMPKTARMFHRNISKNKLHNPNLNIKIGVKLLKRLLKKYDGNLFYTLIAYNAGEGNLKKWKERNIFSDNLLLDLESIPFSETRLYVKLIFRNIFYYRHLHGEPGSEKEGAKDLRYVKSEVNNIPVLY
jgi:soluble lytic murein transglycosylase